MRFVIDAQLSRRLVRHLVEQGHDASHVFDFLSPSADDHEIAKLANRLDASVVTKDADFANLARRGHLQRTLIWVRIPNIADAILLQRVGKSLPAVLLAILENAPIAEIR